MGRPLIVIDTIVKFDDDCGMHYPGGKAKSFHQILNLVPPHSVYIEPYLGLASVLRNKKPSDTEIGIDLDVRVLAEPELLKRGVKLVKADALDFLNTYRFRGHEVVYCDPPYLPSTRKRRKIYRHEVDQNHHEMLLKAITDIDARVLISGYDSDLYRHWLHDWNTHKFSAKTHCGVREEFVWFNFDAPTVLHDYRHLGRDFRERQVIKRRIERLKARIASLSVVEQECIKEWLVTREISDAT